MHPKKQITFEAKERTNGKETVPPVLIIVCEENLKKDSGIDWGCEVKQEVREEATTGRTGCEDANSEVSDVGNWPGSPASSVWT